MDEIIQLHNGSLQVKFDFGEMGKKTATIGVSERTQCEVWSRVMGYFRPTSSWNIGKKQEFKDRKNYNPNHPDIQISRPDFMADVELPPNVTIVRGRSPSRPEMISPEELGRK